MAAVLCSCGAASGPKARPAVGAAASDRAAGDGAVSDGAAASNAPPAAPASESTPSAAIDGTVEVFFRALEAANFDSARALCDENLQQALSRDKLAAAWASQAGQLGALVAVHVEAGNVSAGKEVRRTRLDFERGKLEAVVAIDPATRELSGLIFRPAQSEGTSPPYADAAVFRTEAMSVGREPFVLSASITLPLGAGPFPGVVLVHGSGPHDRDETIAANKPFKDIAEGLASRGVAALRYDKRTFQHASQLGNDVSIDDEVVVDATFALQALRARKDIDPRRVFVIGHSLGALLAPEIAVRSPPVAGLVLLAPPGRAPWDSVIDQMRYLGVPAEKVAEVEKGAAQLRDGTLTSGTFLGAPATYWRDWARRDGVAMSLQLKSPLLIMRGDRDYQVTEVDTETWRRGLKGRDGVEIVTLPGANHLFIRGSGKPGPAEYATPGHVDEAVVAKVVTFVTGHRAP